MFRSLFEGASKTLRLSLDNFVFRLHYRVTVGLLIACAVALLWKINFGNPLKCTSNEYISSDLANDYCWYHGTFTNTGTRNQTVGVDITYPGIGFDSEDGMVYHNIHRWVIICILLQSITFYLPRIVWKWAEGRTIYKLIWNMNDEKEPGKTTSIRKEQVVNHFKLNSYSSFLYLCNYFTCETMNLINVVLHLAMVAQVLQLSDSVDNVLVKSRSERYDEGAVEAFPLQTKCEWYRYDTNGGVHRYTIFCFMSINGFIEVIFVGMYIWFMMLALLSALTLMYRIVMLTPLLRISRMLGKVKLASRSTIEKVIRRMSIGEWFVLYMLSKNLDPLHMKDILEKLAGGLVEQQGEDNVQQLDEYPDSGL